MKTRPIFPLLLSMSLPMVISMLVNSLYNIIDSFFVAKISEDAMTSLSLVFPVQNFISATAIGFGIGINAVIAIYLGAGRKEKADIAATQGLALSAVHGIVLMIVCILIMPAFLSMFTSNKNVIDLGVQYCNIVFTFSPALMLAIAFEKIFQSVGRMKISMFSMLCGCIANIILDPLLIFGVGFFPEMGIKGAALATGIGQVLKKANPQIEIWAVEPENAAILSGGSVGTHLQMGIGDGLIPDILDRNIYDDIYIVTDEEAIQTSKDLARKEGLMCGISSGTNVAAALKLAEKLGKGKTVVTVLPDTAERYFSTPLFGEE